MANAINVIYPYKFEDMWVFDDEKVGLDKEPFVEGADTMIDQMLAVKGLPVRKRDSVFSSVRANSPGTMPDSIGSEKARAVIGTDQRNSNWKVGFALHC